MIRVLHYMHAIEIGGVTDLSLDLIKYSDREYFQFIVACHTVNDECVEDEFHALGVEILKNIDDNYPALLRILQLVKPDILHAQPGANAVDHSVNVAVKLGIPVIATIGTLGPIHNVHEVPLVTAVAGSKELFKRQPPGARFIYHGIDLDRLRCNDKTVAKKHWGLDPARPVVGWIGRFVCFKSPLAFVSIAKYVREVDPNIQFIMFGTHQPGIDLATTLADEISVDITFPGGAREKGLAYGCMDVGCFPTWGEAFGRVPAEMLGAGIPMICSQYSTNMEIAGSHALYLAPPNYWKDEWEDEKIQKTKKHGQMWAWTILALLENEPLRQSMGIHGQSRVRDLFNARDMAKKYNELYREVVK